MLHHIYRILRISFLSIFCFSFSMAQETIPASGGDAEGTGGSASYSIGKVFYSSGSSSAGSFDISVQQPYEIYVITSIDQEFKIDLKFNAYPNPTSDNLMISIEGKDINGLKTQLYDTNGKFYKSVEIGGRQTSISMNDIKPGPYLLRVFHHEMEVKTFKIIKH